MLMVDTSSITFAGEGRLLVSPTPRLPEPLYPHAQRDPSFFTAKEELPSMLMVDTSSITFAGEGRLLVSPTPSWPKELLPHAQRDPSFLTTKV